MKRQSLDILYRYRKHLLEQEQTSLQDRIAEENQQKLRLVQLQARVQETHNAKSKARTVEDLRTLDEAAAYLHGRMILARRAISISSHARQEAVDRTLKAKQAVDQTEAMLEKGRRQMMVEMDDSEREQIEEIVTSRYAMALRGV